MKEKILTLIKQSQKADADYEADIECHIRYALIHIPQEDKLAILRSMMAKYGTDCLSKAEDPSEALVCYIQKNIL